MVRPFQCLCTVLFLTWDRRWFCSKVLKRSGLIGNRDSAIRAIWSGSRAVVYYRISMCVSKE